MSVHRFRDQELAVRFVQASAGSSADFVPCPMFATMTAGQQAHVQAVYRLAIELTREQLKPTIQYPEYSMN